MTKQYCLSAYRTARGMFGLLCGNIALRWREWRRAGQLNIIDELNREFERRK